MAELYPAPLSEHLIRIFHERRERKSVYDLAEKDFFKPKGDPDISVTLFGEKCGNPSGPAAGPHSQLIQNIVLSYLAGSRIIELKTIQILDELKIPRPCIYVKNIGFNVEWSQELKLGDSLREYVGASMILQILEAENFLGLSPELLARDHFHFDASVGYNLEGVRSEAVTGWLKTLRDSTAIIDELRPSIPEFLQKYRDFPFQPTTARTVTLSTFHGCPPDEIESIASYLITVLGFDVIIKMNPTILGFERIRFLLWESMGYQQIELFEDAFQSDMKWSEAVGMIRRLQKLASARGRNFGVKCTNTLVVRNKDPYLPENPQYLSGQPLHVIATQIVKKIRDEFQASVPLSFSAGVDKDNFFQLAALGITPITTCTDLLRRGGYGRLPHYLRRLESEMAAKSCKRLGDFILNYFGSGTAAAEHLFQQLESIPPTPEIKTLIGKGGAEGPWGEFKTWLKENLSCGDLLPMLGKKLMSPTLGGTFYQLLVDRAAVLNTPLVAASTLTDPRYRQANNQKGPKKIGKKLERFDCINCDICIPVCPNNANFFYELAPIKIAERFLSLKPQGGGFEIENLGMVEIKKEHQLATYADFCNECGNCDIFCPEDGGPYRIKPLFFGSETSFRAHSNRDGFFMQQWGQDQFKLHGRFQGRVHIIRSEGDGYHFENGEIRVTFTPEHEVREAGYLLDEKFFENERPKINLTWYFLMFHLYRGLRQPGLFNPVTTRWRAMEGK